MLAAPDQARDDLGHAALLALVRVGHQPLHVRPQQREEGVVEISKQALMGKRRIGESLALAGRATQTSEELLLTLNRQNLRGLNLSLPLRSSSERNSMNWLMNSGSVKWSKMICSLCGRTRSALSKLLFLQLVTTIKSLHLCSTVVL